VPRLPDSESSRFSANRPGLDRDRRSSAPHRGCASWRWENHGIFHGKTMGKPMENDGKTMETMIKMMEKT